MEIPAQVREALILAIDEYLETDNDQPDAHDLAAQLISSLEEAAEDAKMEDSDELAGLIEEQCDLEEPLVDVLEALFGNSDELELTGEDIVHHFETAIKIDWLDPQEPDDIEELMESGLVEQEDLV